MGQFDKVVRFYTGKREGWKQPWGKLWDGCKIFVVDGPHVRGNFFVDYVEGGHGYVYNWIPKDEIWIEDLPDEVDQGINLMHEIYEYTLMKYVKKDYDKAHECTACVEAMVREAMAGKTKLKVKKP